MLNYANESKIFMGCIYVKSVYIKVIFLNKILRDNTILIIFVINKLFNFF